MPKRMASFTCSGGGLRWMKSTNTKEKPGVHMLHAQQLITSMAADYSPLIDAGSQEVTQLSWKHMVAQLHSLCFRLSTATYSSLLQFCGNARALLDGKRIHHHIIISGLEQNVFLANRLGHMYGMCGALQEAHSLFANMHERDVFSWNFLLRVYAQHERKEPFQIF